MSVFLNKALCCDCRKASEAGRSSQYGGSGSEAGARDDGSDQAEDGGCQEPHTLTSYHSQLSHNIEPREDQATR